MLKDERQEIILKTVNEKSYVKNINLAELTNSSIQTIISDISELHNAGRLFKVYGGAKSIIHNKLKKMNEEFEEEKENQNIDIKEKIAFKAAELIEDGDLIFIDTGTSTRQLAKLLKNKDITIITNGYSICFELLEQDIKACLIGGFVKASTRALVGELALKCLDEFYFDKVFIGMNNYQDDAFYTTNFEEKSIKEKVINNSEKAYILMDSTKFEAKNKIKVQSGKNVYLISDKEPKNYTGNVIVV